jgi:pectate lyase
MIITRTLSLGALALAVAVGLPLPSPAAGAGHAASTTHAATGGFSTATGSDERATTVTTLAQLRAAVAASRHHIVVDGSIYGGAVPVTILFASTAWSDTTIEGAPGGKAVLENIQLKFDGEQLPAGQAVRNIVVKNLTFHGRIADLQALPPQVSGTKDNAGINYEGVSLRRVVDAWIDHCTFYDTSDDLLSVTLASDDVTLSNNHFYFTQAWLTMDPDPLWNWVGSFHDLANERLSMVIGANASDSYSYGPHALHVTLHHNWIGPLVKGRPLVRGWVHAYDNYFDNASPPPTGPGARAGTGQYTALQVGSGAVVYSEANYFNGTHQSNRIGLDKPGDAHAFYEHGNLYQATTGASDAGVPFRRAPVSYAYTLDPAPDVPGRVTASAGPH